MIAHSPEIIFITTIILLSYNVNFNLIIIYVCGYILNELLNIYLKNKIKDNKPIITSNEYRMPSGHAQRLFYSLIFISEYLRYYCKNKFITISIISIYFLVCLYNIYICIKCYFHTTNQMIIGSIIGSIIGLLTFHIGNYFNIK